MLSSRCPRGGAAHVRRALGAHVEVLLRESREVLRVRPGVIIVEHRNGYVMANAGIGTRKFLPLCSSN